MQYGRATDTVKPRVYLDQLRKRYDEKRRRIAELNPDDRLPSDIDELLCMRKEIDRLERGTKKAVSIDFAENYLTD